MAFSGRGRGGRGRGGRFGYDHPARHAEHADFPEINLPKKMTCDGENVLVKSKLKFEKFWKKSCYHLEKVAPKKKNEDKELERFSDRKHKTHSKRESLALYLKLTSSNFPAQLLQGSGRGQASNKKLRWDRDSDGQAFEVFEKLEQTQKDGDKKAEKEGDDGNEQEEEAEQEESSDDDYNQNVEFDDDDDDWNQEEETQEDYYD